MRIFPPQSVVTEHDEHPSLTEPVVRTHLRDVHGWSPIVNYQHTYFQALIAHQREHRKSALAVSP